jgi:hypothetical protein
MGRLPLDPGISARVELRSQQLRAEYGLTVEEVAILSARAGTILEGRIHPAILPYDPSIDPENWCEGIGPVLNATVWQACLDAVHATGIRVPWGNRSVAVAAR